MQRLEQGHPPLHVGVVMLSTHTLACPSGGPLTHGEAGEGRGEGEGGPSG